LGKIVKKAKKILNNYASLNDDVMNAAFHGEEASSEQEIMSASIQQKVAVGPRRGQFVRRVQNVIKQFTSEFPEITGEKQAMLDNFGLHANLRIKKHNRDQLENLIGYITRGSVSLSRMSLGEDGNIIYRLKKDWSDGTVALQFSPMELVEKICALIPPPLAQSHQI
jgi:hypothetical protein